MLPFRLTVLPNPFLLFCQSSPSLFRDISCEKSARSRGQNSARINIEAQTAHVDMFNLMLNELENPRMGWAVCPACVSPGGGKSFLCNKWADDDTGSTAITIDTVLPRCSPVATVSPDSPDWRSHDQQKPPIRHHQATTVPHQDNFCGGRLTIEPILRGSSGRHGTSLKYRN